MRTRIIIALLVVSAFVSVGYANPFASDLYSPGGTVHPKEGVDLSYRLNCDATSVTISVFPEGDPTNPIRTEVAETSPYIDAGVQSWEWDCRDDSDALVAAGNYGFSVKAYHSGFSVWTNVADPDTVPYPYDYGDFVTAEWGRISTMEPVKCPASPAFGRMLLTTCQTSVAGTHDDVVTSAGLWLLNADLSHEDPAALPNVTGDHTTARAEANDAVPYPWGESGSIYYPTYGISNVTERNDGTPGWTIANGADTGHTVVAVDQDGSAASLIYPLTPDALAPHDEPQWAILDGQGADRVLYVSDWNYNGPGQRGWEAGSFQDVWGYEIGTTDNNFDTTPKLALATSYLSNIDASICRDADYLPDIQKVAMSNQRWSAGPNKAYFVADLDKDNATTPSADSQVLWSKIGSEWVADSGCTSSYMSGGAVAKDADPYVQMSDFGVTGWPGGFKTLGTEASHDLVSEGEVSTFTYQINVGSYAPTGVARWDGLCLFNDGTEADQPGKGIGIVLGDNSGNLYLGLLTYHTPAWLVGYSYTNYVWEPNTWYNIKFVLSDVDATHNTVDVAAKIWKLGEAEPTSWLWTYDDCPVGDITKRGVLLVGNEGTSGSGDWGIARFDNCVHTGWDDGSFSGWWPNNGDWDIAAQGKSNKVYCGTRNGYFVAYDTLTGAKIDGTALDAGGDYYYPAAGVDAAGNLLAGTYRWREFHLLSPPGENSFTTYYDDVFSFTYESSVDDWYMF